LVDACTTPQLLKLLQAKKLPAEKLITHQFRFAEMERAYQVFGRAAEEKALKVIVSMD
jgi:alcohol dehydrogenase